MDTSGAVRVDTTRRFRRHPREWIHSDESNRAFVSYGLRDRYIAGPRVSRGRKIDRPELAPGTPLRYPLLLHWGVSGQIEVVLRWEENGTPFEKVHSLLV